MLELVSPIDYSISVKLAHLLNINTQSPSDHSDSEDSVRILTKALVRLARRKLTEKSDFEIEVREVMKEASRVLAVSRVGVWLYSPDKKRISCLSIYDSALDRHLAGRTFEERNYPNYFLSLKNERVISASDAKADPRTAEFYKGYLDQHTISSMLDAPIWVGGEMVGILCCEHIGPIRAWTHDDEFFACSIADMIAIMMESIERHRMERELLQESSARQSLEKQLLHVQKLECLGVLATGIAHDFNNFLMAIINNARLAEIELPTALPASDRITQIKQIAEHAAKVTEQLLSYAGKGQFEMANFDLNLAIKEVFSLLQTLISKKAIVNLELSASPIIINGDSTQIKQVVMNLITNASEALEEKEGQIIISTSIKELNLAYLQSTYLRDKLQAGLYAVLTVSDTGCGMTQSQIDKIFDPFFSTKFTGRGLGLAVLLGIVRSHNGAIKVASEPEMGTTFEVIFPLH